jgi:hypothetical protein
MKSVHSLWEFPKPLVLGFFESILSKLQQIIVQTPLSALLKENQEILIFPLYCLSFCLSICLSAGDVMKSAKQIFIKIYIEKY